jgi:hypothetical protein
MMTITASQYRNARRPCRSSTGHGGACSDRQFGPLWKRLSPISASPFRRYNLLNHCILADHRTRSTCRNSYTAPAALKSP